METEKQKSHELENAVRDLGTTHWRIRYLFESRRLIKETPSVAPDIFTDKLIADIIDNPSTSQDDINLEVWALGGTCNANDTDEPFVIVKKL